MLYAVRTVCFVSFHKKVTKKEEKWFLFLHPPLCSAGLSVMRGVSVDYWLILADCECLECDE